MSLSNASNFVINGATFVDNGRDALQLLSQYVAHGATHDSYAQDDAPKCHPDTRIQLLSVIKEWMLEPDKETGILYLHGPAGAGKSCIARSACTPVACPPGFLLASFFFWRGSDERNSTRKLFTTIAYQLAMRNDDLAGFISDIIQRNPRLVMDASPRRQFKKLLLEPCRYLAYKTGRQLNGAIIIDGLDECIDKEAQISVIKLLAKMIKQEKFPLGFFVTSRPELHLKEVWDTWKIALVSHFVSLSDIPTTSDEIRTVLQSGFSRILSDRRFKGALKFVRRPWPYWSDIETLVERSSGQFIYAATVLKFVSDRSHNPDAQLQIILALPRCDSDTSPLADLDSLYREILSRSDDPARTISVLSFLLAITDIKWGHEGTVPLIDILAGPLIHEINADMNNQLLIVEQLIPLPPGEAFLALNDLHSLLDLRGRTSHGHYQPVSFYHKSFRDFLLTVGRSKEYYIDITATHAKIVQSCVRILSRSNYDTTEQHVGWLYAFFVWHVHVCASGRREEIRAFEEPIQRFTARETWQFPIHDDHLGEAFELLGLRKADNSAIVEVTEVITGLRRISAFSSTIIELYLWVTYDILGEKLSRFKRSLICNPLWVDHLKSYKMDLLTVKRSLAINAIIPLPTLSNSGLYGVGVIHELASLPEIQRDMCCRQGFLYVNFLPRSAINLLEFISSPRSSGIFSCTREDFAEAFSDIFIVTTPVCSNRLEYQYSSLLQTLTRDLQHINPTATPRLLAALEFAARNAHAQLRINMLLTHEVEVYLSTWLQHLSNPPQDVIDAWRRAFDKARCAYWEHRVGYYNYLCRHSPW